MRHKLLLCGQSLIERGAWFFAPLSWIWALSVFCKNALYRRRWLEVHRVRSTVVSVGNIVAGGTGKTPFVHLLAKTFSHRRVAILSRGFGEMSDEAMLLQRRLPQVRIYVGKDRVALAKKAAAGGAELILLDDGFQHRRLHRDFDIVLLRQDDPFGKGHFLPWGFLRDSPKRLKEADAVFAGGFDFEPAATRILDGDGEEKTLLQGKSVGLFCGIGNPRAFKKTVEENGAKVVAEWILADHEPASLQRLARFADRCKSLSASAIITTEKDFVKLPSSFSALLPILYLEIELRLTQGRQRWENLIAKIDQKIDNRSTL